MELEVKTIIDSTSLGSPLPAHLLEEQERHRERELMFVLSGNIPYYLEGRMYQATPGCVFFMESWAPHKRNYTPQEMNYAHFWVHFHDKRTFGWYMAKGENEEKISHESCEFSEEILPLIRNRWQLLERRDISTECRYAAQMSILNVLLDDLRLREKLPASVSHNTNMNVVEAVQRHIIMNHGRIFPREELEKLSGYTSHHLMRMFKSQTGMTIGDFINQIRVGYVKSAKAKGLTQKEIGMQLGFSSASAFWLWQHRYYHE